MITGVKCITIVHKTEDILFYREISAYFRLMGIFVCEKWPEDDSVEETDFTLDLTQEACPKNIPQILDDMSHLFDQVTIVSLKEVYKIYDWNKLMRGSYAIEYFANSKEPVIYKDMYDAHGRFFVAYNELSAILSEVQIAENLLAEKYILAAQANCLRRMNQLYTILWDASKSGVGLTEDDDGSELKNRLWEKKYYSINEIDGLIQVILRIDPGYYGAYVIKAFTQLLEDETKVDAMDSFECAVRMIEGKSYSSYLRYRMGRYYEHILRRPNKSYANYCEAYRADPRNYRALYKLSVHEHMNGNDDSALEYLDKIIERLSGREKSSGLQPLECAYLYKSYKNKGKIFLERRDYDKAIGLLKHCEDIYDNSNNEGAEGFYPRMFGETKWEYYKKAARKKLEIWKVYVKIADAAMFSNHNDIYKDYHEKANQSLV